MNSNTAWLNGIGMERVHYFPRQLITAEDMIVEQEYFRQKLRRHNRFLHGWGVVCGLKVTAASTLDLPWQVRIESGYALSPQGDEIYVPESFCFDLAKCGPQTTPNPCEPGGPPLLVVNRQMELYVAIRYVECQTRPVRVHPVGCACDEAACEYSRIRDDFELGCLTERPPSPASDMLCSLRSRQALPACPLCPEEGWVVLAHVVLPTDPTQKPVKIDNVNIDNFVRRQLYSTTMLQEQLIDCCCGPSEPPVEPARVIRIHPEDKATIHLPGGPAGITVTFSKPINPNTVTSSTFKVARDGQALSGTITPSENDTVYFFAPAGDWLPLRGKWSDYTVTLIGTGLNPIKDKDNLALDGYPSQPLPSGDGQAGGDFTSTFRVEWSPPQ